MKCWHCRYEIPDRDLARYLAAKGGRSRSARKLAAVRQTLEKINCAPGQIPSHITNIPCYSIGHGKRRFMTFKDAVNWYRADQERRERKALKGQVGPGQK